MSAHTASDRRLLSKTMFAKPATGKAPSLEKRMAQAEAQRRFPQAGQKKG